VEHRAACVPLFRNPAFENPNSSQVPGRVYYRGTLQRARNTAEEGVFDWIFAGTPCVGQKSTAPVDHRSAIARFAITVRPLIVAAKFQRQVFSDRKLAHVESIFPT
jgi:hypothetical protein